MLSFFFNSLKNWAVSPILELNKGNVGILANLNIRALALKLNESLK